MPIACGGAEGVRASSERSTLLNLALLRTARPLRSKRPREATGARKGYKCTKEAQLRAGRAERNLISPLDALQSAFSSETCNEKVGWMLV